MTSGKKITRDTKLTPVIIEQFVRNGTLLIGCLTLGSALVYLHSLRRGRTSRSPAIKGGPELYDTFAKINTEMNNRKLQRDKERSKYLVTWLDNLATQVHQTKG